MGSGVQTKWEKKQDDTWTCTTLKLETSKTKGEIEREKRVGRRCQQTPHSFAHLLRRPPCSERQPQHIRTHENTALTTKIQRIAEQYWKRNCTAKSLRFSNDDFVPVLHPNSYVRGTPSKSSTPLSPHSADGQHGLKVPALSNNILHDP